MRKLIFTLGFVLLMFCLGIPASASGAEIKPYPGSKHLCGGHVTGRPNNGKPGPHIVWEAYYSKVDINKVADFYKEQLGIEKYSSEQNTHTWSFPDSDKPSSVLGVQKSDERGPWNSCKSAIPKQGTVIMISSMTRPES